MANGRIERLLGLVRVVNESIESNRLVRDEANFRLNKHELERMEYLGRIAFLDGTPRSRCPFSGRWGQRWKMGFERERNEAGERERKELDSLRD